MQWFKDIKHWSINYIDNARVIWIRIYDVPSIAWFSYFFVRLANSLGSFICLDEYTTLKSCLDIARIMIRVPMLFALKESMKVEVDRKVFNLVIREDSFGHMRLAKSQKECSKKISETSYSH